MQKSMRTVICVAAVFVPALVHQADHVAAAARDARVTPGELVIENPTLINLGFELGVIPRSVFFMLVVMAVVTTYMTTPLLRRTIRGTEMEPLVAVSQFMMNRQSFGAKAAGPG